MEKILTIEAGRNQNKVRQRKAHRKPSSITVDLWEALTNQDARQRTLPQKVGGDSEPPQVPGWPASCYTGFGTEQVNIQNVPAFRVIQFIQPKFAALMDLRCAGAKHTASIIPVVRMAGYFIVNTCGYS